jgi:hypothetical protein
MLKRLEEISKENQLKVHELRLVVPLQLVEVGC